MTLVVDASVAVKWLIREEGSEVAMALVGRDALVAPDLLVAEVANVLWRLTRVANLPAEQATRGMEELIGTIDELYPMEGLAVRALGIATALTHPVYDCFYIALAEALDTTLVTADRRLVGKLDGSLRKRVELL